MIGPRLILIPSFLPPGPPGPPCGGPAGPFPGPYASPGASHYKVAVSLSIEVPHLEAGPHLVSKTIPSAFLTALRHASGHIESSVQSGPPCARILTAVAWLAKRTDKTRLENFI